MIKVVFTSFGQRPKWGQYSVGKRKGIGDSLAISNLIWFKFKMELVRDSLIRMNIVEVTFGTLGSGLMRGNVP